MRSSLSPSGRRGGVLFLLAAWLLGCDGRPPRILDGAKSARMDHVVRALEAVSRSGRGLPGPRPTATELAALRRLYEASGHTPLWLNASGDLRGIGKDALQRLTGAESEGLRPEDYAASRLDSLAQRLGGENPADPPSVAGLDAGLSLAVLRYLRHLHVGRVNPRSIGFALDAPSERHDFVVLLGGALQEGSLEDLVAELAPPLTEYRLMRDALAQARKRQSDSGPELLVKIRVPLKPGDSAAGVDLLARRLMLLGDLSDPSATTARYEGALVDAVQRFQARHGLKPDSVLGKETLDELNAPLSWRVHQLELGLERLRWIRDLPIEPFLLVNIPMFELTAWESPLASEPPLFRSGVIVGKALDTETPVFVEEMRHVIFRPYWNIPPSILREEIVPALERDPGYLGKHNMEIVAGQGDDADPVEPSGNAFGRLERGQLRVRQRPGPGNALGLVKFVFPNNQNIYLHGTPVEELFDRSRRDFSHGCVRVEDPVGLAEWVLRDQPDWARDRILAAMEDETRVSRRVNLSRPLTVVLYYSTAWVEADGTVRFARDIYGHDRRLDRALHSASGA